MTAIAEHAHSNMHVGNQQSIQCYPLHMHLRDQFPPKRLEVLVFLSFGDQFTTHKY